MVDKIKLIALDDEVIALLGGGAGGGIGNNVIAFANVKGSPYSAIGDGVTEDTTAFQNAIDACATAGGGVVYIPKGTYLLGQIQIRDRVLLQGESVASTILKAKNGLNTHLVISNNFSTLTGTNSWLHDAESMPTFLGLRYLQIDGNKANQTAGDGIRIYGKGLILGPLLVRDCYDNGIYTEGGDKPGQVNWYDLPEGQSNYIMIRNCGDRPSARGIGWHMRGPHDIIVPSLTINECGSDGIRIERLGGVYNGMADFGKMHIYANGGYGVYSNTEFHAAHCITESNYQEGMYLYDAYFVQIGMLEMYNNCRTSGTYQFKDTAGSAHCVINQAQITSPFAASHGGMLINGARHIITGVQCIGNTDPVTATSTGSGIRVSSTAQFNTLEGFISNFNASGGIGLYTNDGGGGSYNKYDFTIRNCATLWTNGAAGTYNQYHIRGNAGTGQTYFSGTDIAATESAFVNVLSPAATFSQVFIPSGSSLERPGLAFSADSNTGIYLPTSTHLGFVADGIEGARFVGFNAGVTANPRAHFTMGSSNLFGPIGAFQPLCQVNRATGHSGYWVGNWTNSSTIGPQFIFGKSKGGAVNTRGVVGSGDVLGEILFTGDNSSSFLIGANITAQIDAALNGTSTDMPSRLIFSTANTDSSIARERMRITSTGNVGIGTSSPSRPFEVAGVARVSSTLEAQAVQFAIGDPNANHLLYGADANSITFRIGNTTSAKAYGGLTTKGNIGQITLHAPSGGDLTLDAGGNYTIPTAPATTVVVKAAGPYEGRVGINTTTPTANLDVLNTSGSATIRARTGATSGNPVGLVGAGFGDGTALEIRGGLGYTMLLSTNTAGGTSSPLRFAFDTGTEVARFSPTGNFGIGATNPQANLHVISGNNYPMYMDSGRYYYPTIRDTVSGINGQAGLDIQARDSSGILRDFYLYSVGGTGVVQTQGSYALQFATNGIFRGQFGPNGGLALGTTPAGAGYDPGANGSLILGPCNYVDEGGQITFARAADGAQAWGIDVYGPGTTSGPTALRILDIASGFERARFTPNGWFHLSGSGGEIPTSIHGGANVCVAGSTTQYIKSICTATSGNPIGSVGVEFGTGSQLQMRAGLGYTYLLAANNLGGPGVPLQFGANGIEVMRITANPATNPDGKLGIGTNSPSQKLSVNAGIMTITSGPSGTVNYDSRIEFSSNAGGVIPTVNPTAWIGIPAWNNTALHIYGPRATASASEAAASYTNNTWTFQTASGTGGGTRMQIKAGGQVRFTPIATAPGNPETGDMYYNSAQTRMQIYTNSKWSNVAVEGKNTLWIPAGSMLPNTIVAPGPATSTPQTTTNRVMTRTLDFDQTVNETAQFSVTFPKGWNHSTVTAYFYWRAAAGTVGQNVIWGIKGVALSDNESIDTAWGTGIETTDTYQTGTTTMHISPESSAITIGSSPVINDVVIFEVYRNAASASDTLAGDAQLVGVKMIYTLSTHNDD